MMRSIALALLTIVAFSLQAATTIDLTTANASNTSTAGCSATLGCTAASGDNFIVTQIQPQSTGTGVIDSFLRIQEGTTEQGYNTSLSTPLDDKGGVFTRALSLGEVPTVIIGGVAYKQFLLDINQNGNNLINLNQIEIFVSTADRDDGVVNPAASGTGYPAIGFPAVGGTTTTEVFRMSASGTGTPQFTILMDYALNSGSGSGDMFLYVPVLGNFNLAGLNLDTTKVILYSQFGNPPSGSGQNVTNDGFEEWAVVKANGTPCTGFCEVNTPEPGSIFLFGTVLLGVTQTIRKRYSNKRA